MFKFNKELPLWIIIIVSALSLIAFGFLIGNNSQAGTDSDWLIALISAFVGAITGVVLTVTVSTYHKHRRIEELKQALYNEANYLKCALLSYFEYLVTKCYSKDKADFIIEPAKFNFSIFNALTIELYKENSIPSKSHQILLHHLERTINAIYNKDKELTVKNESQSNSMFWTIDKNICLEQLVNLSSAIYEISQFTKCKQDFQFDSETDFEKQVKTVFSAAKICDKKYEEALKEITKKGREWLEFLTQNE